MNEKRKVQMSDFDFIVKELGDAIKAGIFKIIEVMCADAPDDVFEADSKSCGCGNFDDFNCFTIIIDGLMCRYINDNDLAKNAFMQWANARHVLEVAYEREESGDITKRELDRIRNRQLSVMDSVKTAFNKSFMSLHNFLIEPMHMPKSAIDYVINTRFNTEYEKLDNDVFDSEQ